MKKKHLHACEITGSIYGKRRPPGKNVSPNHMSIDKKELTRIYNRFYKNQAAALYRALHKNWGH